MKKILKSALFRRTTDVLLSPVTLLCAYWFKYIRSGTASQMPVSEKAFMSVGLLPIRDQYYQPLVNPGKHLRRPLDEPRYLPGIDWNMPGQLALLTAFRFQEELNTIPYRSADAGRLDFYYDNPSFCPADAAYLYSIIRHFKPRKVIEVGCGYSTRLSLRAERQNQLEPNGRSCSHICVEPYEMPWLEELGVEVIRSRVEDLPLSFFGQLAAGDIFFIDSSHMIRPQGDVLFEFLQILPTLASGVLIHVHDIFSPRDYPEDWIVDQHCQWNEQYLLEAFLSFNTQFSIIGAVNMLKYEYPEMLAERCLPGGRRVDDLPGSFWFIRN